MYKSTQPEKKMVTSKKIINAKKSFFNSGTSLQYFFRRQKKLEEDSSWIGDFVSDLRFSGIKKKVFHNVHWNGPSAVKG